MSAPRATMTLDRASRILANIRAALHTATRICDELASLAETCSRKDHP